MHFTCCQALDAAWQRCDDKIACRMHYLTMSQADSGKDRKYGQLPTEPLIPTSKALYSYSAQGHVE
jgi:hypothetical protein